MKKGRLRFKVRSVVGGGVAVVVDFGRMAVDLMPFSGKTRDRARKK